jgi:hypothetical protein
MMIDILDQFQIGFTTLNTLLSIVYRVTGKPIVLVYIFVIRYAYYVDMTDDYLLSVLITSIDALSILMNDTDSNNEDELSEKLSNMDINEQEQISYIILDESKIDKKMLCPIGQDVMICPMITKCKHTFDKKMIEHWLQKHKTCPLCRTEISSSDLKENIDLVKEMAVLKFKISKDDVEKIITKCEKQKIDVPDNLKDSLTIDFSLFKKINM